VTDDDLMARVTDGDEGAMRALVERWEGPVFVFLERMTGSREEAQDLGQETFLRVYRQAGRYRASGRFRSWLFRIAGNLARSRLRRSRLVRWLRFDPARHDAPSPEAAPDRGLERAETVSVVRAALARLPARQRQAVVLRQFNELSYAQIAEAMDTTVPAVESLLHRAMTALRDLLAREVNE
jgi:RNA polymerase sigma-70 factor (ECF subfamily)